MAFRGPTADLGGGAGPATAGEAGEAGVLALLLPHLPTGPVGTVGPGDDAAVVAAPDGRVVATTDLLVERRDFRTDWSSGADVGVKAVAQNLADLAAMGAAPTGLLVTLGAPGPTPLAWVEDLARGLGEACARWGVGVVGGDLSGSSELLVSVTALGDLGGRAPVLRSGARPGDVLALAGSVGRSGAGLALLLAGGPELAGRVAPELLAAHRRPDPPLAAGVAAAVARATAMLDVSDGLGVDGARLAMASGVHLDLDPAWEEAHARPLLSAAAALAGEGGAADAALSWVRGGGEDHALLATFPPEVAARGLPEPFRAVGRVLVARQGCPSVTVGGTVEVSGGWDVFGASA